MTVPALACCSTDGPHAGVVVVENAARADDNYSGRSDNYTTPRTW